MKKGFNCLIGSVILSLVTSAAFSATCPSVKKVNSSIETLTDNSKQNKLSWLYQDPIKLEGFKGAYYQEKTDTIKKASLTCIYTIKDNGYLKLKLSDKDVARVNTAFNNKHWDNTFYHPSLYSCDGKGVRIADCQIQIKN